MPVTSNYGASARRKVRCPKCTALLTEPPTPIYECPICSTLLLAKGNSGVSGGGLQSIRRNGVSGDSDDNLHESLEGSCQLGKARTGDEGQQRLASKNTATEGSKTPSPLEVGEQALDHRDGTQVIEGNTDLKFPDDYLSSGTASGDKLRHSLLSETSAYSVQRRPSDSSVGSGDNLGTNSNSFIGSEASADSPLPSPANAAAIQCPDLRQPQIVPDASTLSGNSETFIGSPLSVHTERPVMVSDPVAYPKSAQNTQINYIEKNNVDYQVDLADYPESVQDNRIDCLECAESVQDQFEKQYIHYQPDDGGTEDDAPCVGPANEFLPHSEELDVSSWKSSVKDIGIESTEWLGSEKNVESDRSYCCISESTDDIGNNLDILCPTLMPDTKHFDDLSSISLYDTNVLPEFPIDRKCMYTDSRSTNEAEISVVYTDSRSTNEAEISVVPTNVGTPENSTVQEGYNISVMATDFNSEAQDSKGDDHLYIREMPETLVNVNDHKDSETTRGHLCDGEIRNPVFIVESAKMSAATNCSDTEALPVSFEPTKGSSLAADDCYADEQTRELGSRGTMSLLDTSFCDWQSSEVVKNDEAFKVEATDLDSVHDKRVLNLDDGLGHYVPRDPIISALLDSSSKPKQSPQRAEDSMNGFVETHEDQFSVLPCRTTARQRVLQRNDFQTSVAGLSHQAAELVTYESPLSSDLSSHHLPSSTLVKNNQQNNRGELSDNHKHGLTSNVQYAASAADFEREFSLLPHEEKDVIAIQSRLAEGGLFENKLGQTLKRDVSIVQGITKHDTSLEMNVTARVYGQYDGRRGIYKENTGDNLSQVSLGISEPEPSFETKSTPSVYGQLDTSRLSPKRSLIKGDGKHRCKADSGDHTSHVLLDKHMKRYVPGLNDSENADSSEWQEQGQAFQEGRSLDEGYEFFGPADYSNSGALRSKEKARFSHPNELYLSSTSSLSLPNKRNNAIQISGINAVIPPLHEQALSHYAPHLASPSSYGPQSQMEEPQMHSNMMLHHCEACQVHVPSMDSHHVFHEPYNHPMHYHLHASLPGQSRLPLVQHEQLHPLSVPFEHPSLSAWRPKQYPPLPCEGAAPFVLCRGCNLVLQVPTYLPPNAGLVRKLRCGTCGKTSKFSLYHQTSKLSYIQSFQAPAPRAYRVSQFSTRQDLLLSNHGRRPTVANNVLGPTKFMPESRTQYDACNNHTLRQKKATRINDSDVESVDYAYYPRPAANMGGHGQYQSQMMYGGRESVVNHSLPFNEGYWMSSPSGAILMRNASDNQTFEAAKRERAVLGGRMKGSVGIAQHGKVYELEELPSSLNGHYYNSCIESGSKPPSSMQGSFQDYSLTRSVNAPLQRSQPSRQVMVDSDLSRSSSRSSASHLRRLPVAPGSPLIEHFSQASADLGRSLQQHRNVQDSVTGMRSAPWSPAPGSPLHDHLKYDVSSDIDERSEQRDQETEKLQGMSSQDASKGPKYYAGLLKKSLRDFGKGVQGNNNRPNSKVVINGHLIPDTVVRKVEERAGTIYPGSYWYDYQAGFWGVMGGPCIGIIPPFIEEFNFALAEDCAGGMTKIFVNGRELHVKDLQVLYKRGLPITSGKAYIIDITGRVIDAASGQQLESLGKLAPSVERSGRGSGMFQPGVQPR